MLKRTYDKIYSIFAKSEGYIPTRALIKRKVSTIHIRELLEDGDIEKVSHGNYWGAFLQREKPKDYKLVEACMTNSKAVICGPSACYYHGLLKKEPAKLYVATQRTDRSGLKLNFPVSRHFFSVQTFEEDVITYKSAGVTVRVYDVDRSVVDCIRMEDEIGADTLRAILREYKKYDKKNLEKCYAYADKMRVGRKVREKLETK